MAADQTVNELEPETRTEDSLEHFRRLVAADPALQAVLWAESDREAFVALVVELGESHGCRLDGGVIRQAMKAGRRTWIERWLP